MKAVDVAGYMVFLASDLFGDMTNMKFNKLLYYLQGQSLLVRGTVAFDDDIEAWDHGPVVNSVYAKYVLNGNKPILASGDFDAAEMDEEDRDFIRQVLMKYGLYSAGELREMTHRQGTPWRRRYKEGQKHTLIPVEVISDYFKSNEQAAEPFNPSFSEDDFVGYRDEDGVLVLPRELDDEAA